MDETQRRPLRREVDRFVERFDDCIKTRPSRSHFSSYLTGQLSELPHKTTNAIAGLMGIPPRTLQGFLSAHRWDDRAVRNRVREIVATGHFHSSAVGFVDEASFSKKGTKTAGVQRQRSAAGATENCVVTVHLGYATDRFRTLLDGDVYLSAMTWFADPERCREAGIPAGAVYRPKWQIAVDLLERALAGGLSLRWVSARRSYGGVARFRGGVAELGLSYVVEVPPETPGWLPARRGKRPARPAHRLWERGGPSWERWRIRDRESGSSLWDVRAVRFCVRRKQLPGAEQWLLIARHASQDTVRYFLSNAPKDTPLGSLLHVAFSRWHIEQVFRVARNDLGFDHFEGRRYRSLRRHLVLTSASLLFLAEQRARLEREGAPPTRVD